MNQSLPLVAFGIIFLATITTFAWARIFYFSNSKKTDPILYIYDTMVAVHIGTSMYYYLHKEISIISTSIAIFLISLALVLFIWTTKHAKGARIALNNEIENLNTKGPYALVRHPFYLSYILSWTSTAVLFNSLVLWITLSLLVAFYITIAHKEEKAISRSILATKYKNYRMSAGMFLPRINRWKT